jgi:hypothetical protein
MIDQQPGDALVPQQEAGERIIDDHSRQPRDQLNQPFLDPFEISFRPFGNHGASLGSSTDKSGKSPPVAEVSGWRYAVVPGVSPPATSSRLRRS